MFERFTEKSIKVIMIAQEEARRLGHNFLGSEQLLLGLIGEGTSTAAKALKSQGFDLKTGRILEEAIIGRGSGFVVSEIPFTPRAKIAIENAWSAAKAMSHNLIDPGHLLLGLLQDGEGVGIRILENAGIDLLILKGGVTKLVKDRFEATKPIETLSLDQAAEMAQDSFDSVRADRAILQTQNQKLTSELEQLKEHLLIVEKQRDILLMNNQKAGGRIEGLQADVEVLKSVVLKFRNALFGIQGGSAALDLMGNEEKIDGKEEGTEEGTEGTERKD